MGRNWSKRGLKWHTEFSDYINAFLDAASKPQAGAIMKIQVPL
ncbi:hypothetical protein [Hafnia paralvei]|nr:hypothetical protein [Hafnia paralvei]